jgi:hypothetical protein
MEKLTSGCPCVFRFSGAGFSSQWIFAGEKQFFFANFPALAIMRCGALICGRGIPGTTPSGLGVISRSFGQFFRGHRFKTGFSAGFSQ